MVSLLFREHDLVCSNGGFVIIQKQDKSKAALAHSFWCEHPTSCNVSLSTTLTVLLPSHSVLSAIPRRFPHLIPAPHSITSSNSKNVTVRAPLKLEPIFCCNHFHLLPVVRDGPFYWAWIPWTLIVVVLFLTIITLSIAVCSFPYSLFSFGFKFFILSVQKGDIL